MEAGSDDRSGAAFSGSDESRNRDEDGLISGPLSWDRFEDAQKEGLVRMMCSGKSNLYCNEKRSSRASGAVGLLPVYLVKNASKTTYEAFLRIQYILHC